MSLYSERLNKLKKEFSVIKEKKSKKFKKHQQAIYDFVNGLTPHAMFEVKGKKIYLLKGDSKKGFQHILESHYCKGCRGELSAIDILNMIDIIERGIKLANKGVTNSNLEVFYKTGKSKHYKLVLKPGNPHDYLITTYSIG